jgi:hypothetical protein
VRSLRSDVRLVVNAAKGAAAGRRVRIVRRDAFLTELVACLARGARVAVASTSAAQLVALHACVSGLFGDRRLYLIHAATAEAEKQAFARDCNAVLAPYDGLFYSPTIQAGNSIEVPFDELFLHASPSGPTPEGVHQMLGRIRNLRGGIAVMFDVPTAPQREYTPDEVVESLTGPLRHCEGTAAMLGGHFTADWTLRLERTALFQLTVWNALYRVNGYQNFAARFLALSDAKGHVVTTVERRDEGDTARGAALREAMRAAALSTRERRLEQVVAAPALDEAQYRELRKSLAIPSADERTARAVERYEFCECYGLDPAELTTDLLRRYARPEQRGAYHRLCLMLPEAGRDGASVVRRIRDVLRAEGTLLALAGDDHVFATTTLPRTNGVRLKYAHQLLTELGFDSAFDTSPRAAADVAARAGGLRTLLLAHRPNVDAVFLAAGPRRPVAEWETGDVVRYVNACLRKFLGVFVRRHAGSYRLVGTGAWDATGAARGKMRLRSAYLHSVDILG